MHEDEKVGKISNETKFGMITLIDERYNYVWNSGLGWHELRFPLNPEVEFKLGDVVKYVQSHDGRGVQIVHNLMSCKEKWPIETLNGREIKWKAKAQITFAPGDYAEEIYENDDKIRAIAFDKDFLTIANFIDGLKYEEGEVYEAYITRIPPCHNHRIRNLKTIWCLVPKPGLSGTLVKVTDPSTVQQVTRVAPWNICKLFSPASGAIALSYHVEDADEKQDQDLIDLNF